MKRAEDFDREYLSFHTAKEDLFWTTYMGTSSSSKDFEAAESRFKSWISDPHHIQEVRDSLGRADLDPQELHALKGWKSFFEANAIESETARKLQGDLIQLESKIFAERAKLKLSYVKTDGSVVETSTNGLTAVIVGSDSESERKSAHEGLLSLEKWVLNAGFLDLVKMRNRFARDQGFSNYFEYKVKKTEGMTSQQLFAVLDEFEALTRDSCFGALKRLAQAKGPTSILGYNLKHSIRGDAEKAMAPFLPFKKALKNWTASFARLGIDFRGAKLNLDLLDRQGKHDNGFMHGPQPSYFKKGVWQAARINFTSNAIPNQLSSGREALLTLFHEGGHAAHFSNITQNSTCFSQEYPPTSMAYAETQSMFCDSLVSDADWLKLYAKDSTGQAIPDKVIESVLTSNHPFAALGERSILVIPVFESRLYSMEESQLSAASALALARRCEKEVLGVECSPRPILAIPHLLNMESACSYQGYLLAHMAVYQTRSHFVERYGYLTDNPKIGRDLAEFSWAPGNSLTHSETIRALTQKTLSGQELAAHCNMTTHDLWNRAKSQMVAALRREQIADLSLPSLNAEIHVVDGIHELANNLESMSRLLSDFEAAIEGRFPDAP